MPIYGFESQDDFNRARDVIRTVEGQRVDLTRTKRARYPATGSGGGGLRPYIITQTDSIASTNAIAVYRGCGLFDIESRVAISTTPFIPDGKYIPDGDTVSINSHVMSGVAFTNQVVLVQTINGVRQIVSGWSNHFFIGDAINDINDGDTGNVSLYYITYNGDSVTATVEAVNKIGRGLRAADRVYVWFADPGFDEPRFYIQSVECPFV